MNRSSRISLRTIWFMSHLQQRLKDPQIESVLTRMLHTDNCLCPVPTCAKCPAWIPTGCYQGTIESLRSVLLKKLEEVI